MTINDSTGAAGRLEAPVCQPIALSPRQQRAADEGRLWLRELQRGKPSGEPQPAQFDAQAGGTGRGLLWWRMPPGAAGQRTFALVVRRPAAKPALGVTNDPPSGQFDVTDQGRRVLRYNYQTNYPGELLKAVSPDNRKYARERCDYIHPLFGLDGEALTFDWAVDHPHHRGIYWAWPEVDFGEERGDLHALQRVFARPTGQCAVRGGSVFARIEAENRWLWEDQTPIVREVAVINAYREGRQGRFIDLTFRFTALADGVGLARRGTDKYGGLNLRLAAAPSPRIGFHTDPRGTEPRMAWGDLNARFAGRTNWTSLAVLQHPANPDYPGDWVQYPELPWFQPTFPAAGTRYQLSKGQTLTLRYRLWVRRGGEVGEQVLRDAWTAMILGEGMAPTHGTRGRVGSLRGPARTARRIADS